MAYTLAAGKQIELKIDYKDNFGNPAVVDGEVVWESSNEAIMPATADAADSSQCTLAAIGATGSAQAKATADADMGTGTKQIITLFDVTIVAGEAVAGTINVVGDPVDIA